jgi:hypothetical protein
MRNKELLLRRIRTLNGMMKQLDTLVRRGGSLTDINTLQIEITNIIQDIDDIVSRED